MKTVKKAIGNPFIVSKLHFFTYVSGLVESSSHYFKQKPMIPFMYLSLKDSVLKLLQKIVNQM